MPWSLIITPGIILCKKVVPLHTLFHVFLFCQAPDMINGKDQNVYRLPPPTPCPVTTSGEPINLRIPQTEKPNITQVLYYMCMRIIDGILFPICLYKKLITQEVSIGLELNLFCLSTQLTDSVPVSGPLICDHMERWKKIRQKYVFHESHFRHTVTCMFVFV